MSYKLPILMYHSIDNGDNPLSVGINDFNKQMKLLYNFGFQTIDIDDIYCNKKNKKKFIITFDDGYKDNLLNALPILKKYNFVSTCFVVNDMIGKFNLWDNDKKNFNKKELMNENDINEWLKNGQKIGSHSSSHKNLQILSEKEKIYQIENSKKNLENKFNIQIDSFSFPFGRYDIRSLNSVSKNYKYSFTTSRSRFNLDKHKKNLIPRVHINKKTSLIKFFFKIFSIYEDLKYQNKCKDFK